MPPLLLCLQDGFTHLTADPALLLTVANHFYTDIPGEWRVLCIDAAKLTSKVQAVQMLLACNITLRTNWMRTCRSITCLYVLERPADTLKRAGFASLC